MRHRVKEAGLQTLVPTNRNWIQRLYRSDEVAHHTDVQKVGNHQVLVQ